jgi:hypothetical protein
MWKFNKGKIRRREEGICKFKEEKQNSNGKATW